MYYNCLNTNNSKQVPMEMFIKIIFHRGSLTEFFFGQNSLYDESEFIEIYDSIENLGYNLPSNLDIIQDTFNSIVYKTLENTVDSDIDVIVEANLNIKSDREQCFVKLNNIINEPSNNKWISTNIQKLKFQLDHYLSKEKHSVPTINYNLVMDNLELLYWIDGRENLDKYFVIVFNQFKNRLDLIYSLFLIFEGYEQFVNDVVFIKNDNEIVIKKKNLYLLQNLSLHRVLFQKNTDFKHKQLMSPYFIEILKKSLYNISKINININKFQKNKRSSLNGISFLYNKNEENLDNKMTIYDIPIMNLIKFILKIINHLIPKNLNLNNNFEYIPSIHRYFAEFFLLANISVDMNVLDNDFPGKNDVLLKCFVDDLICSFDKITSFFMLNQKHILINRDLVIEKLELLCENQLLESFVTKKLIRSENFFNGTFIYSQILYAYKNKKSQIFSNKIYYDAIIEILSNYKIEIFAVKEFKKQISKHILSSSKKNLYEFELYFKIYQTNEKDIITIKFIENTEYDTLFLFLSILEYMYYNNTNQILKFINLIKSINHYFIDLKNYMISREHQMYVNDFFFITHENIKFDDLDETHSYIISLILKYSHSIQFYKDKLLNIDKKKRKNEIKYQKNNGKSSHSNNNNTNIIKNNFNFQNQSNNFFDIKNIPFFRNQCFYPNIKKKSLNEFERIPFTLCKLLNSFEIHIRRLSVNEFIESQTKYEIFNNFNNNGKKNKQKPSNEILDLFINKNNTEYVKRLQLIKSSGNKQCILNTFNVGLLVKKKN